jgi:hypothetical protein
MQNTDDITQAYRAIGATRAEIEKVLEGRTRRKDRTHCTFESVETFVTEPIKESIKC